MQNPTNSGMGSLANRYNWTASELAMGRVMRGDSGHRDLPGAPSGFVPNGTPNSDQQQTQQAPANNGGGNSGADASSTTTQDNTGGDELDPVAFWSDGDENAAGPSRSDSAPASESSPSTRTDEPPNVGQQLMTQIGELPLAEVFTDTIAKEINEGNFDNANKMIHENVRTAMQQSLRSTATLMREFGGIVTKQVQAMIADAMGNQQNSDYLVAQIPAASNKKVGPAIRAIYDRALERTKGDKTEAVKQTKAMMRTLTTELAGDLDLSVAPRDPDSAQPAHSTNWLEELTSRP